MLTDDYILNITTPPQHRVLELLNQSNLSGSFTRVVLIGKDLTGAELILRLPYVQRAHSLELLNHTELFDSVIPVGALTTALVEWLHFDDHDENGRLVDYGQRTLSMYLCAMTMENQNEFLETFWRLLCEVVFFCLCYHHFNSKGKNCLP